MATTGTASTCGHPYPIIDYTNDQGQPVTIHHAYPDPNAAQFDYEARELCQDCYVVAMNAKTRNLTPKDIARAFRPC